MGMAQGVQDTRAVARFWHGRGSWHYHEPCWHYAYNGGGDPARCCWCGGTQEWYQAPKDPAHGPWSPDV